MEQKDTKNQTEQNIKLTSNVVEKNSHVIKLINDCNMLWKRNPL